MFGIIVRFDLVDEVAAGAFDALVATTSDSIKSSEPGTLLYAINKVDNAPLSRVFYEVYVDQAAFEAHETTPHVKHFLAEREKYIAALRVEFLTPTGGKNVPGAWE